MAWTWAWRRAAPGPIRSAGRPRTLGKRCRINQNSANSSLGNRMNKRWSDMPARFTSDRVLTRLCPPRLIRNPRKARVFATCSVLLPTPIGVEELVSCPRAGPARYSGVGLLSARLPATPPRGISPGPPAARDTPQALGPGSDRPGTEDRRTSAATRSAVRRGASNACPASCPSLSHGPRNAPDVRCLFGIGEP